LFVGRPVARLMLKLSTVDKVDFYRGRINHYFTRLDDSKLAYHKSILEKTGGYFEV